MTLAAVFLTFVVTIVFLFVLRPLAAAIGLLDVPGGRKRHGTSVPLIGGICMSIGLGFGTTLIDHPDFWDPVILGIYLLVVVGTIDDRFELPPNVRLIAQACAALLVVFASEVVVKHLGSPWFFDLPLGPFAIPFTVLFIVTMINAYNIIDGLDGLAGGLALTSLTAMAVVGVGTDVLGLVLILIAVVVAFLLFNLPMGFNQSVRTFMGDAGSTFLGLAIASIGIWLSQGPSPSISPVAGLWLVAIPVFDFFSTIVRRLLEGRPLLSPDHAHLHHVLTESGLSRQGTVAWIVLLGALSGLVGIVGSALLVPDGIMLLGWFAAGLLYYQMLRQPRLVVGLIGSVKIAVLGRESTDVR